jgi:hypothetical protein
LCRISECESKEEELEETIGCCLGFVVVKKKLVLGNLLNLKKTTT